jgi:hypothetical protein
MDMPHRGKFFGEWVRRMQHAEEPPRFDPVDVDCNGVDENVRSINKVSRSVGAGCTAKESVDAIGRTFFEITFEIVPGASETCPPMEVNHPSQRPRELSVGFVWAPEIRFWNRSRVHRPCREHDQ